MDLLILSKLVASKLTPSCLNGLRWIHDQIDIRSIREYLMYRVLGENFILYFEIQILNILWIELISIKEYLIFRFLGQRLIFFFMKYAY